MTSKVEVANLALGKIGAGTITSFSDNSDEARAVNRFYTPTLRAELRAHPWSCARKRDQLAALSDAPVFGFSYQYQLPSDCVRILPDADVTDWQVEGRRILTNDSGPLDLTYIGEISDPNDMDALLVEAFACRLAMTLAERLTQSNTKRELAKQEYKETVAEARRINAFERVAIEPPEDPWITAMR